MNKIQTITVTNRPSYSAINAQMMVYASAIELFSETEIRLPLQFQVT